MKLGKFLIIGLLAAMLPLNANADLSEIRDSAMRGDATSQLELGILYEYGYGMPNSQIAALAWYGLSAQQGNKLAATRKGALVKRLPQADVDKAAAMSATLLSSMPAATRVSDAGPRTVDTSGH